MATQGFHDAPSDQPLLDQQYTGPPDEGLPSLDDEIAELRAAAEKLAYPRVRLTVSRTSAALAPILRLPAEIMTMIFSTVVHESRMPQPSQQSPRTINPTMAMSGVNLHWRRIVLSIPALWSYINLDPGGPPEHQALWLARSSSHPLHIHYGTTSSKSPQCGWPDLHFGINSRKKPQGNLLKVLQIIQPQLYRVESLYLDMSFVTGCRIFYNLYILSGDQMTRLQSVTLYSHRESPKYWFNQSDGNDQMADTVDRLAPLRTLRLHGIKLCLWHQLVARNLTELTLDSFSGCSMLSCSGIFKILQASPNLQTLKLLSISVTPVAGEKAKPVYLDKLKLMSLKSLPWSLTKWLLGTIHPALKGLTLIVELAPHGRGAIKVTDVIAPFLAPNSIEVLQICQSGVACMLNIDELLLSARNLQTLVLQDGMFRPSILAGDNDRRAKLVELVLINSLVSRLPDFMNMLQTCAVERLRMYGTVMGVDIEDVQNQVPDVMVTREQGLYQFEPGPPNY